MLGRTLMPLFLPTMQSYVMSAVLRPSASSAWAQETDHIVCKQQLQ